VGPADLAAEVALVARVLARLGFVHAFGHVSARAPAGERVLLTPTSPPLGALAAADVLELDQDGRVLVGSAGRRPLEAPLHLAVYAARPDVGAICRVHAPAVAASAAVGEVPPLLHGFGGMVEPVAVWDDPDLVAGGAAGGRAAGVLGDAPAMLLAGNGGLTVGAGLDQALARAWCLEDRCRVALAAGDRGRPLTGEALERRRRWYDAETARLARWLRQTAGA
jgi:HCOMODA/2-hydroxy-3-carboxy-muconic semialdehyde decarboxylase